MPHDVPFGRSCHQRLRQTSGTVVIEWRQHDLTSEPFVAASGDLVIVVHGVARKAAGALRAVALAGASSKLRGATRFVAPQFRVKSDLRRRIIPIEVPVWRAKGWSRGDRSAAVSSRPRISSFEVIDLMIKQAWAENPRLRRITIAGHSAGGQFVHRYAAASPIVEGLQEQSLEIRFVLANPSSYLYLGPNRPCASNGQEYDAYKYGLNEPNAYLARTDPNTVRERYARRRVTYLVGSEDRGTDPDLDVSAAALAQGRDRYDRALHYQDHLSGLFGGSVLKTHRLRVVEGVGHDARGMFGSPAGIEALFGP